MGEVDLPVRSCRDAVSQGTAGACCCTTSRLLRCGRARLEPTKQAQLACRTTYEREHVRVYGNTSKSRRPYTHGDTGEGEVTAAAALARSSSRARWGGGRRAGCDRTIRITRK